jgi:hypothetical protein
MFAFCIYEFTPFYMIRTATAVSQNMMMMMTVNILFGTAGRILDKRHSE